MFEQYNELVTVEEFMEMINIGKNAAYKLLSSGEIKCFRFNRKWKIPKQSVIDYIFEQTNWAIKNTP